MPVCLPEPYLVPASELMSHTWGLLSPVLVHNSFWLGGWTVCVPVSVLVRAVLVWAVPVWAVPVPSEQVPSVLVPSAWVPAVPVSCVLYVVPVPAMPVALVLAPLVVMLVSLVQVLVLWHCASCPIPSMRAIDPPGMSGSCVPESKQEGTSSQIHAA